MDQRENLDEVCCTKSKLDTGDTKTWDLTILTKQNSSCVTHAYNQYDGYGDAIEHRIWGIEAYL